MKSARYPALCNHSLHSRAKPLAVWQRLCLALYAGLFAGVLPFICLGALGEPGHPHRFPHFVFAMPQLANHQPPATATSPSAQATQPMSHHAGHANQGQQHPAPITIPTTTTEASCPLANGTVPGRATATILIFTILQLILLGAALIDPWARRHFVRYRPYSLRASITLIVPLPPPRWLPAH